MSSSGRLPVPVDPDRIALVIGRDGSNKRRVEEAFNVKIHVDSEKGFVFIEPGENATMYNVFRAKKAVEALALGFSIDDILLLANDLYDFEIVDLSDVARNQADLVRIKSRIIGAEGKFRKTLEEITGVKTVIGDKVVGLIGDYEQLKLAKDALSRLVRGQSHQTVLKFLERESFGLKRRRLDLWEKMSQV